MATFDYSKVAATAHRLLEKFGRDGLYTRQTAGGTFNASTLSITSAATAAASVVVADFDYETLQGGQFFQLAVGGAQVLRGDRQVLMSPKDVNASTISWNPQPNETLQIGSDVFRVVRLEQKIAPGGTTALFILQVRKGP